MQTVSIIRKRGQLTIPDSIRKSVDWVNTMSAVTITLVKPNEITLKPHQPEVDWDNIWKSIHKVRSIKGKATDGLSAAEFLEIDRRSH